MIDPRIRRSSDLRILSVVAAIGLASTACVSSCFRAGTRVRTPRGPRRIEELGLGDLVVGFDPVTRRTVEAEVLRVYVHDDRPLRKLRTRQGETYVTEEHPYFVPGAGFRVVRDLAPDAALLGWSRAGDLRVGSVVAIEDVRSRDRVFNLHVSGPSTYFADDLLVHNKSPVDYCGCDANPRQCTSTDLDEDGVTFDRDCDETKPSVGACTPGQTRVRLPWCVSGSQDAGTDAGTDAGPLDASASDDGG